MPPEQQTDLFPPTDTPAPKKVRVDTEALRNASHLLTHLHSFSLNVIRVAFAAQGVTCEVSERDFISFMCSIDVGRLSQDNREALFHAIGKTSR